MAVSLGAVHFLIVAAISAVAAAVRYWQQHGNEAWPMTEARVFDAAYFNTDHNGRGIGHHVRVQYSYKVAGEYYSGEMVKTFNSERQADAFAALYPRDLQVIVRANPEKPEISVMRDDDNAANLEQTAAMSPSSYRG
jgi:uncharacterized protein DUF3592